MFHNLFTLACDDDAISMQEFTVKTLSLVRTAAIAAALLSSSLYAEMHDRRHHHSPRQVVKTVHHHDRANWAVPLVLGGVLVYALSEPRRESPAHVQTTYAPPAYSPLYEERWVYFGDCDCQRKVLVKVR